MRGVVVFFAAPLAGLLALPRPRRPALASFLPPRMFCAAARSRSPTLFCCCFGVSPSASCSAFSASAFFGSYSLPSELDLRDLTAVATAMTEAEDASVAARTLHEAWHQLVEQLGDDVVVRDDLAITRRRACQRLALRLVGLDAALGDRDQPFDERSHFLRLGHGGYDVLVVEQTLGLRLRSNAIAVLRIALKLSMCQSVSHESGRSSDPVA